MKIPKLYETDGVQNKMIYLKYQLEGCYWLIAEVDPKTRMAFGYAKIHCGEWGYISLNELEKNLIPMVGDWIPKKFSECEL